MASETVVAPASQANENDQLVADVSSLQISADPKASDEQQKPAHRSHDPDHNQKRSDPFQFGSRYLQENDDVFEFNAWDHVETDDTYKEYSEQQYAMQRASPVSDFDKCKFFFFFHCLSTLAPQRSWRYDDLHHKHSSSELSMKTTLYFIVFRPHLIRHTPFPNSCSVHFGQHR